MRRSTQSKRYGAGWANHGGAWRRGRQGLANEHRGRRAVGPERGCATREGLRLVISALIGGVSRGGTAGAPLRSFLSAQRRHRSVLSRRKGEWASHESRPEERGEDPTEGRVGSSRRGRMREGLVVEETRRAAVKVQARSGCKNLDVRIVRSSSTWLLNWQEEARLPSLFRGGRREIRTPKGWSWAPDAEGDENRS